MTATLDAALSYAECGLRVIPVRPAEKRPLLHDWPKRASEDRSVVRRWWAEFGSPDVGIATGGGLVVIDIDPGRGGTLAGLGLPPTVEAVTGGGGRHLYYRSPSPFASGSDVLGPGVDVRAEGGFVVAPPSGHISGHEYEWIRDVREEAMASLPGAIGDRLVCPRTRSQIRGSEALPLIPAGRRNDTLASLAGHMRATGLSEGAIADALCALRHHCEDPSSIPETEIREIAASIGRYPAGQRRDPLRAVADAARGAEAAGTRLSALERLVYLHLVNRADWRTAEVQLAWKQLEQMTGSHKTTIRRAMGRLSATGLVELVERGGEREADGAYVANRWRLHQVSIRQVPDEEGSAALPLTRRAISRPGGRSR